MLFSITFGFFSSGYSATSGGILNRLECEGVDRNEAIDSGMVYGLLNGVRGIGYLSGGLASVVLLKAEKNKLGRKLRYGTTYGPHHIHRTLLSYWRLDIAVEVEEVAAFGVSVVSRSRHNQLS